MSLWAGNGQKGPFSAERSKTESGWGAISSPAWTASLSSGKTRPEPLLLEWGHLLLYLETQAESHQQQFPAAGPWGSGASQPQHTLGKCCRPPSPTLTGGL